VADPNSSILKKIVVNHIYNFLRRNFRQGENLMAIPHVQDFSNGNDI
jgi:KUP system potassium uptake protein